LHYKKIKFVIDLYQSMNLLDGVW